MLVCALRRPVTGTLYPSIAGQVPRSIWLAVARISIAFAAGATLPEARAFPAGPAKLNVAPIEPPLPRQFAVTLPRAMRRKRAPEKDASPLLETICIPRVVAASSRCPVPAKVSPWSKRSLKSARSAFGGRVFRVAAGRGVVRPRHAAGVG